MYILPCWSIGGVMLLLCFMYHQPWMYIQRNACNAVRGLLFDFHLSEK